MKKTILITGGTGLVGKALTKALLSKGYAVTILTREKKVFDANQNPAYAHWDLKQKYIDPIAIQTADHIIHLAGAGVADKRWTKERKQEIRDSRVHSGELLVKSLQAIPNKVQSVVSASAIGWYGPDPEPGFSGFIESDPHDNSFLGITCKEWEEAIDPVSQIGKRLVKIRIGIVLAKEEGAFPEFARSFRFGVKAILGSGRQVISWIHINDLVNIFIRAIETESMTGVYNGVAPHPVTHQEMMKAIGKAKRKFFLPLSVPAVVLKILLGEMSVEVLKSTTVRPVRLVEEEFAFQFSDISGAVGNLTAKAR